MMRNTTSTWETFVGVLWALRVRISHSIVRIPCARMFVRRGCRCGSSEIKTLFSFAPDRLWVASEHWTELSATHGACVCLCIGRIVRYSNVLISAAENFSARKHTYEWNSYCPVSSWRTTHHYQFNCFFPTQIDSILSNCGRFHAHASTISYSYIPFLIRCFSIENNPCSRRYACEAY